jgi:hypothetical protein
MSGQELKQRLLNLARRLPDDCYVSDAADKFLRDMEGQAQKEQTFDEAAKQGYKDAAGI